jgi:hypothetical protein
LTEVYLGTKTKKFKLGDLVTISEKTHWDGSEIERSGIIVGPGHYHESYMVLFTTVGIERQFHGTFITLLSQSDGEKINFNKNI